MLSSDSSIRPKSVPSPSMGEGEGEGEWMNGSRSGTDNLMLQLARSLRTNQTKAELVLWNLLRARRFAGVKFVRQAPIKNYIADFCSSGHRVIVEVDGGQHDTDGARDRQRTRDLEADGFIVSRFWNNEVLNNLEGVASDIEKQLKTQPLSTRHGPRMKNEAGPNTKRSPSP